MNKLTLREQFYAADKEVARLTALNDELEAELDALDAKIAEWNFIIERLNAEEAAQTTADELEYDASFID